MIFDPGRRISIATLGVFALLLLPGCATGPDTSDYPVTEHARPFQSLSDAAGSAPAVAERVTFRRILNARDEPQNWLTYFGAYDGQRYSELDEINRENIKNLRPAWVFQFGQIGLAATPATYAFEAAPIVVDGVMYVTGWDGYLWALNAETGQEYWRYKHPVPLDTPLCCGNVNRGAAVAKGKVFMASPNGHLVALDARNGDVVWQKVFADIRAGESATIAPLVVKNLVIVGSSGAEYGIRGHIDAFDIDTGERVWRRYTVPKPGESGSETWPEDSDAWARGGGSAWITATYDPELDLMYWGTGNPSPDFDGSVRRGDNLYTSSVIAIDPDDGAMRWHYQWTPHDLWDYDGNNENILFDLNGRKLLAHFDKNGYLFILDRTNGEFVRVVPFANPTWGDIDAAGNITVKKTPTPGGEVICPGPAGGKEWNHAAYNPRTELLYAPVIDGCATFTLEPGEFRESLPYWGGNVDIGKHPQRGHLKAFNPATGEEVWSWDNDAPMVASVLTTAGDLVFTGEPTGEFNAYDARTGELLWQFNTGSGIHSNPVTYSVNGKQYIAVPSGWGGWVKGFAPDMLGAPRGDALFVFSLPE
ncbi:MAG: PQQ-dependent dehydrogenase, methanol/ethanol family [Proteobacteria bacterium]|nr:PQQ-dependent dehydrogenase, methanol/ethanol family [Pseudomonadota bacterium]